MQALSTGFSDLPSFIQIMVVSRQEYDIQQALGSHPNVCPYPLNIESATNRDVSEFVQHCLEEICANDEFFHNGHKIPVPPLQEWADNDSVTVTEKKSFCYDVRTSSANTAI
jgi:hypothetical protein